MVTLRSSIWTTALVACGARARARRAGGGAGGLSGEADRARGSVPAGRRRRHRRAPRGRRDGPLLNTPVVIENKAGAGGGIGMGYVAEGEARRLHAAAGAVVDLDHSRGRQGHRARADVPAQPVRPDRAVHRRPDGARGPRREPVEDAAGIRRRCPQAARRDQLRLVGQLRNDAHPDGNVRGERRSQAAARALHRRRTRRGRAARRHRRRDLDRPVDGDPACQGRQGARAGVVGRQAARGAARRPDADGSGIQRRSSSSGRRCSRPRERPSRRSSNCAKPRAPQPPIRGSSPRWRRWKRRSSISTRPSCSASGRPTRRSSAKPSGASARSSRPRRNEKRAPQVALRG